MTVIDAVFCVGRACYKQTRDAFQPSRLTGVRLWAVITLQTVWLEMEGRSGSYNDHRLNCIFRIFLVGSLLAYGATVSTTWHDFTRLSSFCFMATATAVRCLVLSLVTAGFGERNDDDD